MRKYCFLISLLMALITAIAFADEGEFTPGHGTCGNPWCYWETPMDITDPETVWEMLIQPITVIDGGQKDQIFLLREPDENAERIGEITCYSQGVHVLENRDDGWSLIECYSSSFYDSKTLQWNRLVTGYVRTELLKEKQVKTKFGLVVDKLTQRLYIFRKGELYDTLRISTGIPNAEEPFNETRSGEFILCSKVGEFPSEDLFCSFGIRFNNGDMIHEVPHLKTTDPEKPKDYHRTEPYLGQRASHGCIRVQRYKTSKGVNMEWLWNQLYDQLGTRIVIWEDLPGRTIIPPDGDTPVYYNPHKGKNYHADSSCENVNPKYTPMKAFRYDELDNDPYAKLTPCEHCVPPMRIAEIREINRMYAAMATKENEE